MGSDKLIISSKDVRVYVLVEVQPGKEVDFGNEILSNGLVLDSKVERLDFVHGYFDFVIELKGKLKEIDQLIIQMRKSPYVIKTQTLICFEMFTWDWDKIKSKINEKNSKEKTHKKDGLMLQIRFPAFFILIR